MSRFRLHHVLSLLFTLLLAACGDGLASDSSGNAGAIDTNNGDGLGLATDASATQACVPNVTGCSGKDRYICTADGSAFVKKPCDTGTFCDSGNCVQCVTDKDCADGGVCNVEGVCKADRLTLTTDALASGLVGAPYKVDLLATGGKPPYIWTVIKGALAPGLTLDGSTGALAGTPTAGLDAKVTIEVKDQAATTDSKEFALKIVDAGLVITTASPLKNGTDGQPYTVTFAAQGGTPPYFWGLAPNSGSVPPGLTLGSDGKLAGTINGDGSFGFDIRVFDNGANTLKATKHFDMNVALAPLDIVGTQQVDLFIAKLIVLPLIVVAKALPVPYSAQLEATGGKKPYHWKEVPMPGVVKSFIKNSGIPAGLTLQDNGTFSGAVTDPGLVVTVDLSILKLPSVSGFFFSATVTDSQTPPQTKTGLFVMPTVPIGGP